MATLAVEPATQVRATSVRFTHSMLYITLNDEREIGVPLSHFKWLAQATAPQRANWSIEPQGYAVWWNDLDDGIEVCHLLDTRVLA